MEIGAFFGVLAPVALAGTLAGPPTSLSALALVAPRPQGCFLATDRPNFSARTPSSHELRLSCTAPGPTCCSSGSSRLRIAQPASQRFAPLRHVQPEEPASFEAEEPPPPQLAVHAVSTASTAPRPLEPPRCFHPERPWGSPFRAFSSPVSGPQVSLEPLPSCRLALPQSPMPPCGHTEVRQRPAFRAALPPESPDVPREWFRLARARCSPELSASPGRSPSSCRRALRPRSPLALDAGRLTETVAHATGVQLTKRLACVSRRCLPS